MSAVAADEYVCPFLFDFLTVKELGRAAAVCKTWKAGTEDDELWWEVYERTQVLFCVFRGLTLLYTTSKNYHTLHSNGFVSETFDEYPAGL